MRFRAECGSSHLNRLSEIECIAPSNGQRAGSVAIAVSFNGKDYVEAETLFSYVPIAIVHSVQPSRGPLSGMTVATLSGSNFLNTTDLMCRFGDATVSALFVSSTVLTCETPTHVEGAVDVFVTTNGQDSTVGPSFRFRSAHGHLGATTRVPTMAELWCRYLVLVYTDDLVGRFGLRKVVAARWVSSVQVECITLHTLVMLLLMSNNGKDFTAIGLLSPYLARLWCGASSRRSGLAGVARPSLFVAST